MPSLPRSVPEANGLHPTEAWRNDLYTKVSLRSLLDLQTIGRRGGEASQSRLWQVVTPTLAADAEHLLKTYGGNVQDQPVPFAREEVMMRSLTQKYLSDVISEMEESMAVFSTRSDSKEGSLSAEIRELSTELSQPAVRQKGLKEQERNCKMKELIDFYLQRLAALESQPRKILEAKLEELRSEALQSEEAYRREQIMHADCIKEIRREEAEWVQVQCDERQQAITMAKMLGWLARAGQCIGFDRNGHDSREVAPQPQRAQQPPPSPLGEEAQAHRGALDRAAQAGKLLDGFVKCLERAYPALIEEVDREVSEARREAPLALYAVRCLAVKAQLQAALEAQKNVLLKLFGRSVEELRQLELEKEALAEMLDYMDDDEDEEAQEKQEKVEQKKKACQDRLRELERQSRLPEEMERSLEKLEVGIAERAAEDAEPGMPALAEQWLQGFFFTHRGRGGSLRPVAKAAEAALIVVQEPEEQ